MSIEDFKGLMDEFDPASLLPELDSIMSKVPAIARIAILAGPVLLVVMGLVYLFATPKEANYHIGFRCYYGMGSVEAWQFTQRLAGKVWVGLGLVLSVIMLLIGLGFSKMQTMDLLWRAVSCVLWEAVLTLAAYLTVNVIVIRRFDKKGELRVKAR